MRAITIRVTREHIDDGEKNDCRNCPVARAIHSQFPTLTLVRADLQEITFGEFWVNGQLNKFTFQTPEKVAQFMNRFDFTRSRKSIRPFSFTLIHPQLPL